MGSQDIDKLYHFIKRQLDDHAELKMKSGHVKIQCPNLSFDVFIIQQIGIEIPATDRRRIILSQQQLLIQFNKITNRLMASSGNAHRIYARQTVLARIDKRTAMAFQKEHHLQIALPGKYRYGLYLDGELVSAAIFSGGRKIRDKHEGYRSFELIRFCHKSDHIVIGGLSKLIHAFIKDFQPNDIMTYVDLDWSQDSSLKKIGFQQTGYRKPELFWIHQDKQIPITSLQNLPEDTENHPDGYLYQNSGSIKLILQL